MSRVDEAMRRAAGDEPEHTPADSATIVSGAEDPADVAELSRTSFPIEMPDPRRPRAAAGSHAVQATPAKPAEAPGPVLPRAQNSLLERMDPNVAQKVVVDKRVLPSSREQYRRLAASLHHAHQQIDREREQGDEDENLEHASRVSAGWSPTSLIP